jgi:polysaccharide export outer membrane protein
MVFLTISFNLTAVGVAFSQETTPSPATQKTKATGTVSANPEARDTAAEEKISAVPLIGVGDLIKVTILGAPESDQEVRVGADGDVPLHFLGPVHVAGLTIGQAQTLIAKRLQAGGFYTEPQVSVLDVEYATQGVSVLGEVQKPGVYPLLGPRRLFDLLSLAGGTTPKAGKEVSIAHRDHPQQAHMVSLSNDPAKSAEANVEVFPGDTIVVAKAGIVYVVGEVRKPSGLVMENGSQLTVLEAIAMAEGATPAASLNKAKLVRKTPNGPREIPLQLKKILAAQSPDVPLQPDDIIFVPASVSTKRSVEAIIQTATGIAVYSAYRF